MPISGQPSLGNFYKSVTSCDPLKAALMSEDIVAVSLNALTGTQAQAQDAAQRLRETARGLSERHRHALERALTYLGYS